VTFFNKMSIWKTSLDAISGKEDDIETAAYGDDRRPLSRQQKV